MLLCLDVGNSHIFGGCMVESCIVHRFRIASRLNSTSDEMGSQILSILSSQGLPAVRGIAIASVVPHLDYSLRSACIKYFSCTPFSVRAGIKTGLKIQYQHPNSLGADRVTNAVAATHLYPDKNVLIFDLGTASTACVVDIHKVYRGGAIAAGMQLSMDALQMKAAKLSAVEILKPSAGLGDSTMKGLQVGLYESQLGFMQRLLKRTQEELQAPVFVLGTGGFSHLFQEEGLFNVIEPDLVLKGLAILDEMNRVT